MAAPVAGTNNSNQTGNDADASLTITLTNAPSAGGIVVVIAAIYSGGGSPYAWLCSSSGGSGVTITKRYDGVGTGAYSIGLIVWTVEYTTAPSSLTVYRENYGAPSPYISVDCINISGQNASYFGDCDGSSGTSSTPVATALDDLPDDTCLVLGGMTRDNADGTTVSAGTNWTQITEIDEGNSSYQTLNTIKRTPGAAGAYDPTWSLGGSPGSDTWYAVGISIKGTSTGATASPGAGALTLAGLAPTALRGSVRQPGAGAATISGLAPVALRGTVAQPAKGTLTLSGLAPTALSNSLRQPSAGSMLASGQSPIALRGSIFQPGAAALLTSGLAPVALVNALRSVPAGSLTLVGLAPTATTTAGATPMPGAGALSISGLAPTAARASIAQPSSGSIVMAGSAPTAKLNVLKQPGAGSAVFDGLAPNVSVSAITPSRDFSVIEMAYRQPRRMVMLLSDDRTIEVGAGALTLSGRAPTATSGGSIVAQPSAGALTLTGLQPTVAATANRVASPASAALTITGAAPAALVQRLATPAAGAIVIAGRAPVVGRSASPGSGALALSGLAPSVSTSVTLSPGAAALVITGAAPSALSNDSRVATPAAGALLLTGLQPTASASGNVLSQPGAGALTLATIAPTAIVNRIALPGAGSALLAGRAPTASTTSNHEAAPSQGALTLTGLAPIAAVSDLQIAQPGAGAMVFEGQVPAIPPPSPEVSPDPAALAIFGQEPTLVISGDGILSAKYLGGARKNVPFKPAKKKREPEPKKAAPAVKPSPLLLGLLARGLALPEPMAPIVEEIVEPAIVAAPPMVVEIAPPPAPPTLEEILQARFDSLDNQLRELRAELVALRAPAIAAQPTPRDPVAEAIHAILPAIGQAIDLDDGPPGGEFPEPVVAAAPPAPMPPKMTREEIDRENERRAARAAELLL